MTFIPNPAFNATDTADRNNEIDPITEHNVGPEHIIDETNQSASTYRSIIDLNSYKDLSLHWVLSGGVTLTFWASNDASADDSSDTGWEDVTSIVTGNASEVDNSGIAFVDIIRVDRLMIKYVTSDATNATDIFTMKGN